MQPPQGYKKKLVFTVTNDLTYDQRMIRICSSLQLGGYDVLLIGRKLSISKPLQSLPFQQKRLKCFFNKGKLFYAEYNLRLFFYLLFKKADLLCAIDLDTILPVLLVSKIRNTERVFDAHELFCEMKEIVTRPTVYKIWKRIEHFALPHFKNGYTVNKPIRDIFLQDYQLNYEIIMNTPVYISERTEVSKEQFILYQGTVNEGRCFESLIPAFQYIDCPLYIYGDGNFLNQAKKLVKDYNLESKIYFKGKLLPNELKTVTNKAILGVTLFENNGLSNYLSLANRFFDYIHAGVPQICVDFPAYHEINEKFEVAELARDLSSASIARHINGMLHDPERMKRMEKSCMEAAKVYNWQLEEKKLLEFYKKLL
jgi:Glycosyltransferase